MLESVKVYAPATVANVCCAFDVLGFAIEEPGDYLLATKSAIPGVRIAKIIGDQGALTKDALRNAASVAAQAVLTACQASIGIDLVLQKDMPLSSGLRSSAASAVAGAFAANLLLGEPFKREELLPFALKGESTVSAYHADNVAPSLLGGFTLVRSIDPLDVIRLPVSLDLFCAAVHPAISIQTSAAREILKRDIPLKTAVIQWANIAGLVAGLTTGDTDLIRRSFVDVIIEPDRGVLIPGFKQAKHAATDAGALGCSISGSGPSLFALAQSLEIAQASAEAIIAVFRSVEIDATAYISRVDQRGARIA